MSVPASTKINLAECYNVAEFCKHRITISIQDPAASIKGATGLSKPDELAANLKKGQYIPILVALWSEKNASKRLTWLRNKQNEFHAPLMFEQGIAEFIKAPTVSTIINTTMPLSIAAAIRIDQDATCSPDQSISDVSTRMFTIYKTVLDTAVQEYCKPATSATCLLATVKNCTTQVRPQVLKLVKQIVNQKLPSPKWVGYHGFTQLFEKIEMCPESEWEKLRSDFAKLKIHTIEQEMQTDKPQSEQADDSKIDK